MNKVIKSYMKSFVKSWTETLGIILFLVILSTIVLGMFAVPFQVDKRINDVKINTNVPDTYTKFTISNFSKDFIDNYFIASAENDANNKNNPKPTNPKYKLGNNIEILCFEDYVDKILNSSGKNNFYSNNNKSFNNFVFSDYFLNLLVKKADDKNLDNISKAEQELRDSIILFNNYYRTKNYADLNKGKNGNFAFSESFFNAFKKKYASISLYTIEQFIFNEIFTNKNVLNDYQTDYEHGFVYTHQNGSSTYNYEFQMANTNNGMGQLYLEKGRLPILLNEAVVSSAFFYNHKLKLGDFLNMPLENNSGSFKLKIVGVGEKYDTLTTGYGMSGISTDNTNFSYVFIDKSYMNLIFDNNMKKINTFYSIERIINKSSKNVKTLLIRNTIKGQEVISENYIFSPKTYFATKGLTNITIQVIIYFVLGAITLFLAFLFLNFVIKKELNQTRVQLGIFKASGYTTASLSWIFALKTAITIFIGMLLGYFCSFPIQIMSASEFDKSILIHFEQIYYHPIFLSLILFLIPLFFTFLSYSLTIMDLLESPLSLINNSSKIIKKNYFIIILMFIFFPFLLISLINKWLNRLFSKRNTFYGFRMRYSFTHRSLGKFVLVTFMFGFAAFTFTTQLSANSVLKTMIKEGYASINKDVDHSFLFSQGNSLKVFNDKKTNQNKLQLSSTTWNPTTEMKYIDYSRLGYENTLNENYNIDTANKIDSNTKFIANYFANKYTQNSTKNFMYDKYNILDLATLISISIYPYDKKANEHLEDFDKVYQAINPFNFKDLKTAFEHLLKNGDQILDLKNWLSLLALNNESSKLNAFYYKDFAILLCTILNIENKSLPDFSDQKNWEQLANNISYLIPNTNSNSTNGGQKSFNSVLFNFMSMMFMLQNNKNYDPLITTNSMLYDSTRECLYYNILATSDTQSSRVGNIRLKLLNGLSKYGDYRKFFNFKGVKSSAFAQVFDEKNISTASIPAIISYRYARALNLKINDVIKVNIGQSLKIPVTFKVVGINYSQLFLSEIIADYGNFMDKYYDPSTTYPKFLFNSMVSKNEALEGSVDFKNIAKSISNMKTNVNSMAIGMPTIVEEPKKTSYTKNNKEPNVSILGSLLGSINTNISSLINSLPSKYGIPKLTTNIFYFNNASVMGLGSTIIPYKIVEATLNEVSGTITSMMFMFIIFTSALLLILLTVIINIIIDESTRIILTMRAMGYRDRFINWLIMGDYIIWNTFSLIAAYIFTLIVWVIVQSIIWKQFAILLSVPTNISIPLISFAIMWTIMGFAWFAAISKLRKRPIAMITTD